jgi:DtxR family Mn-dependent transcriptional regulator
MRQSKSVEDFLEALLMLEEKKEPLETTKVAEILQVSKPAVHQMGHELIAKGYITREDYGDMTLTPTGRKLATEVYHRHKVLKPIFWKSEFRKPMPKMTAARSNT